MPREEDKDPFAYDPEEFAHIPKEPSSREQKQPTIFDDEWKNHKALIHILVSQAVPAERITDVTMSHPLETIEDLATINARLFQLGEQFGIPRKYILKEVERISKRAEFRAWSMEDVNMSWLKTADDGLDGPELSATLPKKDERRLPGIPEDKESPGIPGKPPTAPPMGGKPPMPGKGPGMGGKAPGAAPKGADEIKSLLDKGDLQGALMALKKLVGEPEAKPKQAPFLGKPKPKPEMGGEGAPQKPKPEGESPLSEEGPEDKKSCLACGNCGILLEASCPTCEGSLTA